MSYVLTKLNFPSSDGKNTVYSEIYVPKTGDPRGVVQLVHGMIDYTGRYTALAEYLTDNGFILAGNHHLGHGLTAASADDLGHFADKGGYGYVLEDVHAMNQRLHAMYPTLPVIMLGHSMGSFISRLYVGEHPESVSGLIIHGTGGPNPLVGIGKALAGVIRGIYGPRHKSALINKMAFGAYNKKFPSEEGHNAWLTRDLERVKGRDTDPLTSFEFSVSSYIDLFSFLGDSNSGAWFKGYPKNVPTLVMSGEMDPVGDYGKGPRYVYKQLMISGVTDVKLKMYEGARHELFNELNMSEVFADLLEWLEGVVK